jgi:hypothetical protein
MIKANDVVPRLSRVVVENVNHPGAGRAVDRFKYQSMRRAVLKVLPRRAPGLTLEDARAAVLPHLPESLFPASAHAGWWFKTVQLDLEAKGLIARERTRPLRIHRC